MYFKSPYPELPPFQYTNIHDHLFHDIPDIAERRGDITFHIDSVTGKTRTWSEFVDRVQDCATALGAPVSQGGLGLDIEDGEKIGIMSENCLDYLTLVHSLWAVTVPFALISFHLTPFELEHILRVSQAKRLFVHPDALDRVMHVASKMGIPSERIYILEGYAPGRISLDDMINRARVNRIPRMPSRPAGKDTLAYMVFSSGTTGPPKAVMISHGNLLSSVRSAMVTSDLESTILPPKVYPGKDGLPIFLGFLPLHHCYGLILYSIRLLLGPSTLVVMPKWNLNVALDLIVKHRITHLALIPSVVHQMVNSPKFWKTDLSSVMLAGNGAAYLSPELASKFASKMPNMDRMNEGFGMSEGTMSMITVPSDGIIKSYQYTPGSCGVPVPGSEIRILRDDGSEADVNEPGNLFYRGPNVALGYYGNEQATRDTFSSDGWLKTGDRFRCDGTSLFFEDRAKDTLKVSGIQVSPREIEDLLLANPDKLIVDAVVAGVSGGRTSDEKIPRAWVVLSESAKQKDGQAVIKALKSWSEQNLSKYKWLRGGIEIVDQIPKSPTGKVLRRLLQDRYEESVRKIESRL